MGIQGLLPFLKKIHKPVNIAEFQGCTVAIDSYCWLHKGAFSCAEKLALGEKTEQYVYYCMKYIDYMLKNNLKPILVLDGCHLKSKADVEKTRRERRELHRKKAAQLLREGKRAEAKECLQRCVDITPQMALQLMNACRDRGVDCIVAPYEADAQLAYLALKGIAQIVVTEDSDLLLFGCDKIIFKMDFFGNGTLIEKSRLNEVLSMQSGIYTFEKFRQMCILSGCDYLASLPGIGLAKACKVFKTARQTDITQVLKKLPTYLKMNITVPSDYIEGFIKAENTFLYQLVYDPLTRKLCPLNQYPPEIKPEELDYAGQYLPANLAYQIAIGNIDIHDHKSIAFFDPDTFQPKNAKKPASHHELSIWNKSYRIKGTSPCKTLQEPRPSLHDKVLTVKVSSLKRSPRKRKQDTAEPQDSKTNEDLLSEYGHNENKSPGAKKVKLTNHVDNVIVNSVLMSEDLLVDNATVLSSTPVQCSNQKHSDEDNSSKGDESLTAANIGEEIFKSSDDSVENTALTPTKGRNIFAKNSPAAEKPKFSLDSFAVEVKSRYFHNKSPTVRSSQHKKTSPLSQTPQLSKKSQSSSQNALQEMFKASFKLQKEIEGKKEISELNGQSLQARDDKIVLSARESFSSLKNNTATSQSDKTSFRKTDNETLKQTSSESSIFHQFQSSFSKGNNSAKLSSSPAFSWSQSRVKSNATDACVEDIKPDCNTLNEKISSNNEVKISGKLAPCQISKFFQSKPSLSEKKSTVAEKNQFERDSLLNASNSLAEVKNSSFVESNNLKTESHGKKSGTETNEGAAEEVIELKSLSYSDYLNSIGSGDFTKSGSNPCEKHENICFDLQNDEDELLSKSSSTDDYQKLTSQEDQEVSAPADRGSEFIDLTEDDQVKKNKVFVRSGSTACRAPGLSRKKKSSAKSNITKCNSKLPQQMSIKELMCKFQYNKTSEIVKTQVSSSCHDDDDNNNDEDVYDMTPNSLPCSISVANVQRKLCL